MTSVQAMLIGLTQRYLRGFMDPYISALEVQKLMYFAQEAGQHLGLNYAKGLYGPYANNLRHVLNAIEGHFLTWFADGGEAPDKQLELVPDAVQSATSHLEGEPDTRAVFDRVAELVDGFESPFGLELLATVHWVVEHEGATTPDATIDAVHTWNQRKQRFSAEQILLARNVLQKKCWFSGETATSATA